MVVCTDSYSLYECLVKFGSTKEKRLIIDIIALRQMYERRELFKIRWINGHDNPADAMTKLTPNKTLETFIDTNKLRIRIEGRVKRRDDVLPYSAKFWRYSAKFCQILQPIGFPMPGMGNRYWLAYY